MNLACNWCLEAARQRLWMRLWIGSRSLQRVAMMPVRVNHRRRGRALVLDPRLLTRHPDPQSPVNHPREQWQRVGCFVESSCDVLRCVLT